MQNDINKKVEFDFRHTEAYEVAAMLFTLTAYPPSCFSDNQIDLCMKALVTKYIRWKQLSDNDWATNYQRIKPIYTELPEKRFEQIEKKFDQALQDRLNASSVARRWLEDERAVNTKPTTKQTIQAYLNELSEYPGTKDFENIRNRVWRKSISVIHLAMAIAHCNRILAHERKLHLSYFWYFENPILIKEIIKYASGLKEEIIASTIKISSADLLEVGYLD